MRLNSRGQPVSVPMSVVVLAGLVDAVARKNAQGGVDTLLFGDDL